MTSRGREGGREEEGEVEGRGNLNRIIHTQKVPADLNIQKTPTFIQNRTGLNNLVSPAGGK